MNRLPNSIQGYIQRLLKEHAEKLWDFLPQHQAIIQQLFHILTHESHLQNHPPLAPTQYILSLPPAQADALRLNSHLLDVLAMAIHRAGHNLGLCFPVLPRVMLNSERGVLQGFDVEAMLWEPQHLQIVPLNSNINIPPPGAYGIINDTRIVSLEKTIIHIGRRPDNDLVLDDPRVSRLHAQLRANQGHFMLFDLDSISGTFVNNQRIHATMLYPGDMILIAGISIIYGQHPTRPLETGVTAPIVTDVHKFPTTMPLHFPHDDKSFPSQRSGE